MMIIFNLWILKEENVRGKKAYWTSYSTIPLSHHPHPATGSYRSGHSHTTPTQPLVHLRGLVKTYGIVSISSQIQPGNRTSKFNTLNATVYLWLHKIETNAFVSISSQIQPGNRTSKFNTPNATVYLWLYKIETNAFVSISSRIQSGNRTSRYSIPKTRVCRLSHPIKTSCTVSLNT